VLAVTSVTGNIFADRRLAARYRRAKADGKCERLLVSRIEIEKLRLRRTTDGGTDVGLVLEPGSRLHHGDVLSGDRFIVVEQLPEKVAIVHIKKGGPEKMIELAALVGHAIGNRHRPVAIEHGTISFPLQAESEIDVFKKVLPDGIRITIGKKVFLPAGEFHTHE
jgi:urease accessory protein